MQCAAYKLQAVLVLLPFLSGCGDKTLSRPKAAELLGASAAFKQPKTYPFVLGKGVSFDKAYETLASEGFIDITQKRFGQGDMELTKKGQEAVNNQNWKIGPDGGVPRALFVPMALPKILEITGIATSEKAATVDFTWKWTLTPIGQTFTQDGITLGGWGDIPVGFTPGQVLNGRAIFQLYDDGWRVTDVPSELRIGQ
jgi:hypothetical protein